MLPSSSLPDGDFRRWPIEAIKCLHLEMGMQCNVRCLMCYQTDFSPKSRMSDMVWRDRLWPVYQTAKRLVISGGEPTVLPNCRRMLETVVAENPHLALDTVTNGILFEGIWEEVFLRQGAFVNFSLNAVTPELYRRIVQFGHYDKVVGNIQRLVRRKQETGSSLTIRLSMVMFDQTVDELPRFVQWAVDHGLDQVLVFTDHFGQIRSASATRVQKRIAETFEIADRNPSLKLIHLNDFDWYFSKLHRIAPVRPRGVFARGLQPCFSPFETLYVNSDGSVKPCCKSWYLFGNLETSSLAEVWQSQAAFRFRKRMLELDFRDCMVACDLNCRPIDHRIADIRKAYWVFRRNPRSAVKKVLRKLGFTTAQREMKPKT